MKKSLLLERMPSTETETEGFLSFASEILATIELPWIDEGFLGGKPFESCVPAGVYRLIPHKRPNGDRALALINPELGVYYQAGDRVNGLGRYLILIHVANWVSEIVGCIAPGKSKTKSYKGRMVQSSSRAMRNLLDFIGNDDAELTIRWIS